MTSSLLQEAERYVAILMGSAHIQFWPFHNINHVRLVVEQCEVLADVYKLTITEREELLLSAWFHDTGYIKGAVEHEQQSCELFLSFIGQFPVDTISTGNVIRMIMATRYPADPHTIQEKIVCDADLYHLSLPEYAQWSKMLLQEVNIHQNTVLSEKEWTQTNISFLSAHQYFTEFAIMNWQSGKNKNLLTLQQVLKTYTY